MLLAAIVVVPLAGALGSLVLRSRVGWSRGAALVSALVTAVATAALAVLVSSAPAERLAWAPFDQPGTIAFTLVADGLAVPFVLLTAILGVVAVLASWRVEDAPHAHFALLLALEAAVAAVFLAGDLISFYVAWEAVLIPMFFLIGRWGHEGRRHAAMKFFIYTFAASAPMLVGLLTAIVQSGAIEIASVAGLVPEGSQTLVFWLLAAGMLVKLPVWPLHTWLPDAHVEAPTAGSIMLAGVLLKMGGYGILRVAVPIAPQGFAAGAPILAGLGLIGIVYGGFVALGQRDLKRLVAYSSVAHMGFVILGIATGSAEGFTGAVLAMVSHGFVAALLFLLVGALYERTHTRDLGELGGLAGSMPRWAGVLTFAALASLGLPGLSGFPGELLVLLAGMKAFSWWMIAAAVGMLLAAAYNLVAVRAAAHGPLPERWVTLGDLDLVEGAAILPLGVGIVVVGLAPGVVGTLVQPVLSPLLSLIGGGQ